ncbi:MAG TPA: hypothetical protein VFS97_15445 [Nitrososphaeraceae archaeon]|nr:hypothetical protein [Nitrososphaeraceae archaeon]
MKMRTTMKTKITKFILCETLTSNISTGFMFTGIDNEVCISAKSSERYIFASAESPALITSFTKNEKRAMY